MDGRKTCIGCGTVVVKPVTCGHCSAASHPGCLSRTGHAFSNGKFTDCNRSQSVAQSRSNPCGADTALLNNIKELLRKEFDNFRDEIREMYQADMAAIRDDIRGLMGRVDRLEKLLEGSQRSGSPDLSEEEIIAELEERQKRSLNLIFFNLEEVEESASSDEVLVKDIVNKIIPSHSLEISTTRIGRRQQGRIRPLKVALPSKELALTILRNRMRYSGPVKISQDQTVKQRNYLKDLQAQLKSLKDAGVNNKTIRYRDGAPRIVNVGVNANSASKN